VAGACSNASEPWRRDYFFDDFFDPLLVVFFDFLAAIDTSFPLGKD
jgi:hypothetical protein